MLPTAMAACRRALPASRASGTAALRCFSNDSGGELRKTPLHALNAKLGAKTTGFGGWDMPLHFEMGILKEHLHCRSSAGLFDVSHMLGLKIHGADRAAFAESVVPADVRNLAQGAGALTFLPNDQGGIIDDCIVTNAGDHLYLVINAGHETKDIPHLRKHLARFNGDVSIEECHGKGILALQGPKAVDVLRRVSGPAAAVDFNAFQFMTGRTLKLLGADCFVTRSGYTGEDGFEIACPAADAVPLAEALLSYKEVAPIGLGARDSLRLEAGLCLYGNDIDDNTDPVSAGLLWTIPKSRRTPGGFVGSEPILAKIADPSLVTKKRVGFVAKGARLSRLLSPSSWSSTGPS
jgi:aminomethyltransferase